MRVRHGFNSIMKLMLIGVFSIFGMVVTDACGAGHDLVNPPVKGYPNGHLLVSTGWVQKNIGAKDLVIIDVRTSGYEASHIPGAINLVQDRFKTGGKLRSLKDLEAGLTSAGLSKDMKFVIYDDPSKPLGTAGWFFWLLEYLGCTDVHVLDGGWAKWLADGGAKQAEVAHRPKAGRFVAKSNGSVSARAAHIAAKSKSTDFALIDARSPEEFNGWQLYGESRGGHIPEAVNINYLSFYNPDKTVMEYKEVKSLLESRGITPDKEVVSYSTDGIRSGSVYFVLRLAGYERSSNYDGSIREWSQDAALPMEKLARYERLVYPAWVKDLIDGKNPPTYSGKRFVILETRYTGFSISQLTSSKQTGYIPGAVSVHPCYVEHGNDTAKYYPHYSVPGDAKLLPADRLQTALANLGITKDTTIVVYGNGMIIPMTAARVAWALMYAGVKDVRVLNGGFTAWQAAGYPVAPAPAALTPAKDFGAQVPLNPEFYATADYVRSVVNHQKPAVVMVDVRKREEFDGKTCPYPFFNRKGRIPGAVWQGDWDALVNTKDDTFKSYPEVRKMWQNLGITSDREPVFYCGTGWRSTIGFFQAYLMGFQKLRNYDGSFYDWSSNAGNPIADGSTK